MCRSGEIQIGSQPVLLYFRRNIAIYRILARLAAEEPFIRVVWVSWSKHGSGRSCEVVKEERSSWSSWTRLKRPVSWIYEPGQNRFNVSTWRQRVDVFLSAVSILSNGALCRFLMSFCKLNRHFLDTLVTLRHVKMIKEIKSLKFSIKVIYKPFMWILSLLFSHRKRNVVNTLLIMVNVGRNIQILK